MEGRQVQFHPLARHPRMFGDFHDDDDDDDDEIWDRMMEHDAGERMLHGEMEHEEDEEVWDRMMEHEVADIEALRIPRPVKKFGKGVVKRAKRDLAMSLTILGLTAPELGSLLYVYGKRLTSKYMEAVQEYIRGMEEKEARRNQADRDMQGVLRQLQSELARVKEAFESYKSVAQECLTREQSTRYGGPMFESSVASPEMMLRITGERLDDSFVNMGVTAGKAVETLLKVSQEDDVLDNEILTQVSQTMRDQVAKEEEGVARGGAIEIPVDPEIAPPPLPPRETIPEAPPVPQRPSPRTPEPLVLVADQANVVRRVAADVTEEGLNDLQDVLRSSFAKMRASIETEIPEPEEEGDDEAWQYSSSSAPSEVSRTLRYDRLLAMKEQSRLRRKQEEKASLPPTKSVAKDSESEKKALPEKHEEADVSEESGEESLFW